MKRSVLIALIDALEHEVDDAHFDMCAWLSPVNRVGDMVSTDDPEFVHYRSEDDIPHCKTAGCIAGTLFLRVMTADQRKDYLNMIGPYLLVKQSARIHLGVDNLRAEAALFEPSDRLSTIKREHAIAMLKNLLDTGEIDWLKVVPPQVKRHVRYKVPVLVTFTD